MVRDAVGGDEEVVVFAGVPKDGGVLCSAAVVEDHDVVCQGLGDDDDSGVPMPGGGREFQPAAPGGRFLHLLQVCCECGAFAVVGLEPVSKGFVGFLVLVEVGHHLGPCLNGQDLVFWCGECFAETMEQASQVPRHLLL